MQNENKNIIAENLNHIREDYLQLLENGKEVAWSKGHQAAYEKWKATRGDWNRLSMEEKAKSFQSFLSEEVRRQQSNLIQSGNYSEEEKQEFAKLAARGQLLLASTDGEEFNLLLTPEQAQQQESGSYIVFSPILGENNLEKVMQKQSALHIVSKLSEHYRVQNVNLQGSTLVIQVEHPEGFDLVNVDLTQDLEESFKLQFQKEGRKGQVEQKTISFDEMDEEFGILPQEPSLKHKDAKSLKREAIIENADLEQNQKAAMAALAAGIAAQENNKYSGIKIEQEFTPFTGQQGAPLAQQAAQISALQNVMANKASLKARTQREEEKYKRSREYEKKIYEHAAKQGEKAARENYEKQKLAQKKAQSKKSSFGKRLIQFGVPAATGVAGLGGGVGFFLTTLT